MATNLSINPELLQKALEVSGLKTKRETVNLALREFINRHKQLEILDCFGKDEVARGADYPGRIERSGRWPFFSFF